MYRSPLVTWILADVATSQWRSVAQKLCDEGFNTSMSGEGELFVRANATVVYIGPYNGALTEVHFIGPDEGMVGARVTAALEKDGLWCSHHFLDAVPTPGQCHGVPVEFFYVSDLKVARDNPAAATYRLVFYTGGEDSCATALDKLALS